MGDTLEAQVAIGFAMIRDQEKREFIARMVKKFAEQEEKTNLKLVVSNPVVGVTNFRGLRCGLKDDFSTA